MKTPNKENVTAKLQDIDKRWDELLELLDSLQTLYGENKHASLAASTGDEADKMIDHVDNETKEARLFLSQSNSKESKGNNTSQIATFESAHGKNGHMVDANKQLKRIRIPKFLGNKKEYQCGQRFPVVWMKQTCELSLNVAAQKLFSRRGS